MAVTPTKYREIIFLILYGQEVGQDSQRELESLIMEQLKVSRSVVRQACERAQLIVEKIEEIDELVQQTTTDYDWEKISPVEKNILRIGTYELLFDDAIPDKVAIAEGIRLGKKFSSVESAKLMNAVLDQIHKNQQESEQ